MMRTSGEQTIRPTGGVLPIERMLHDNAFVSEMALKNIKDFKGRTRANMVPRVAKRIDKEERKNKDL